MVELHFELQNILCGVIQVIIKMKSRGVRRGLVNPVSMLDIANIFGTEQSDSLTFKLPSSKVALNRTILKEVEQMKNLAASHRMLYVTANQVESLERIFLINRLHSFTALTHPGYSNTADYSAYINPKIIATKGTPIEVEEQCLAIPFVTFLVPRYPQINIQFHDELRDCRVETFSGKVAQLVQHCINHLDGQLLLDYELSRGRFYIDKQVTSFFPKTNFLLKEYSLRLKTHHEKVARGEIKLEDGVFQEMKKSYIERLKQDYSKQSRGFSQKIQNKTFI